MWIWEQIGLHVAGYTEGGGIGRNPWNLEVLRGNVETYCSGNSPESMSVTLVKTPSNGGYGP